MLLQLTWYYFLKPLDVSYVYKTKEIIYVGRLDFVQKRVYRVIDTWNYLEEKFPDWRLTIVGDGGDRDNLEGHVKALGLKHVSFEGFQSPIDYYKRASLLMLTSDFEGFPLVLAECMSFGVVPVVYNSYAAVGDIISVPYTNEMYEDAEADIKIIKANLSDNVQYSWYYVKTSTGTDGEVITENILLNGVPTNNSFNPIDYIDKIP